MKKDKPWIGICSSRCWHAIEERCRCKCEGKHHGGHYRRARAQKRIDDVWNEMEKDREESQQIVKVWEQ